MTRNNKILLAVVSVVAIVVALLVATNNKADASAFAATCVPSPETTQVVVVTPEVPAVPGTPEVPAVTETIHHDAIPAVTQTIPAFAGLWANFAPNKQQGVFVGPPTWPTDARGTWKIHNNDGGPDKTKTGVFQNGEGNGSWFYREAPRDEQVVVITPAVDAWDETVVITPAIPATPGTPAIPAVTQTIVTPAVVCNTPTETPTVPVETPVTPEVPEEETPEEETPNEETPDETPEPDKDKDEPVKSTNIPKDVQVIACVDGVWTITVNGEVVSESGTCGETPENAVPQTFSETGL